VQILLQWKSNNCYIFWVCVCVARVIQHATRMRRSFTCGLSSYTTFFHISHTCSGRNRITPLMRRPNTDSTPNKTVTLPRNQLLIRYAARSPVHTVAIRCYDTRWRYMCIPTLIWLLNLSLLSLFLVRNSLSMFPYSEACNRHRSGGKYRNIQGVNCKTWMGEKVPRWFECRWEYSSVLNRV
jgi:hypothetical protein